MGMGILGIPIILHVVTLPEMCGHVRGRGSKLFLNPRTDADATVHSVED